MASSHLSRSYSSGPVARAVGIPIRRLEGWAEQGLVTPRVHRGRSRHGDRRLYTWPDVLTVAVLAEAQRLLGATTFRPGGVAAAVAKVMRSDRLGVVSSVPDAVLAISMEGGARPKADLVYYARVQDLPRAALVIKLADLAKRVQEALDANGKA